MGLEATCVARSGKQTSEGKAALESDRILFRGEFRLSIPLKSIQAASAEDGALKLTLADGPVVFELGSKAEKWAQKILHPPTRADKLGLRPGLAVAILGVRDDDFHKEVEAIVPSVSIRLRKQLDLIFFAAERKDDLRKLQSLFHALAPAGALWVIYPKGVASITENQVLQAGREAGLTDTKVASFSSTYTGLKFVIPVAARAKR
jgi:hypothetical protein